MSSSPYVAGVVACYGTCHFVRLPVYFFHSIYNSCVVPKLSLEESSPVDPNGGLFYIWNVLHQELSGQTVTLLDKINLLGWAHNSHVPTSRQ